MKLLFVHQHLGDFAGAEANLLLTATELRERGHALALAYERGTGRNEAGWQRIFDPVFPLQPRQADGAITSVMERWKPDLVYVHSIDNLALLEALVRSRRPLVRMVHDHSLYCLRQYKYNYFTRRICTRPASLFCVFPCLACVGRAHQGRFPLRWNSYRRKRRELRLNQQCDRLIAYSEYSKAELVRNGFDRQKIHVVVPLRVWQDETLVSSYSENLVLFAGQLIRGKGVDLLLKALSQVKADFHCVILGQGNHRPHCEAICRRLGLSDRVSFAGYVPPDQMRGYYLRARVFAMSSVWPEPFGLVGPEAMRYGLPVVAFDAGGVREWLQDGCNGYLVPWADTTAFAERLEELLRNPLRAQQLGRQARASVRRYEAGLQVDGLEELFLGLLGQRPVAPHVQTETVLTAYD